MGNNFIKNGILLSAVSIAMRSVAMFFGAFLSRKVGAEGTGLYTLIMTVYSFAVTIATSGISLTVTRLVASAIGEQSEGGVKRVLKGAFSYAFVFGFLATAGLFFGAEFLGDRVLADIRTVSSLKILALSLIPVSLSSVISGYFVGVRRVGFNAISSVFCQIVKILLTVVLVSWLSIYGTVSAVVGICVGTTLTELLGLMLVLLEFLYDLRSIKDKGRTVKGEVSSVAAIAMPIAFSTYVRSLLLNLEHILIPRKLREKGESNTEAYSHYGTLHGMALPLITFPMSPLSSFAGLLVPEFAEGMSAGKRERMERMASRAVNATLAYATVCAMLLYTFSEELGYFLYRSYEAGYYISVLSLVVPIMYLDHVTDSMLKGIGEQVFSMWVNISDSFLSVILVWLLIPKMGIMGYALVIILMEGYNFILSYCRLRKKVNFKIDPIRAFVMPSLASLLSAWITLSLFKFNGSSFVPIWLILKIFFFVCVIILINSSFSCLQKRTYHLNKKSGDYM